MGVPAPSSAPSVSTAWPKPRSDREDGEERVQDPPGGGGGRQPRPPRRRGRPRPRARSSLSSAMRARVGPSGESANSVSSALTRRQSPGDVGEHEREGHRPEDAGAGAAARLRALRATAGSRARTPPASPASVETTSAVGPAARCASVSAIRGRNDDHGQGKRREGAGSAIARKRQIDHGAGVVEVDDAADEHVAVRAVVVGDVDVGLAELRDRSAPSDPVAAVLSRADAARLSRSPPVSRRDQPGCARPGAAGSRGRAHRDR